MADPTQGPGEPGEESRPDPVRVLIPSPLGALGIELTGELISRVLIVPKGRERRLYRPFGDFKRGERFDLLEEVLGRFSEYLAGARRNLDLKYDLRLSGMSGFPRRVLKETAKVPYGRTRTYQQVAEAAGQPDAYRQVLSVLQVNPLPLVVPCHRVVTTKAGVGSFIAGAKKKTWLLRLESRGVAVR